MSLYLKLKLLITFQPIACFCEGGTNQVTSWWFISVYAFCLLQLLSAQPLIGSFNRLLSNYSGVIIAINLANKHSLE